MRAPEERPPRWECVSLFLGLLGFFVLTAAVRIKESPRDKKIAVFSGYLGQPGPAGDKSQGRRNSSVLTQKMLSIFQIPPVFLPKI